MQIADHQGYVAGRYRDGLVSDGWTQVDRCAGGTFVGYVARCTCGWVGVDRPPTEFGAAACRRDWAVGHLGGVHPRTGHGPRTISTA